MLLKIRNTEKKEKGFTPPEMFQEHKKIFPFQWLNSSVEYLDR